MCKEIIFDRLKSVQREYFDWALWIFSGYNVFVISFLFYTFSLLGTEAAVLDLY